MVVTEPRGLLLLKFVEILEHEISHQNKYLDVCANIISDVLHHIRMLDSGAADLSLLFKEKDLIRTVIKAVIKIDRRNPVTVRLLPSLSCFSPPCPSPSPSLLHNSHMSYNGRSFYSEIE